MNMESIKTPYLNGYRASQQGECYSSNPYDQNRTASKYAWFAGFNDHKAGYKLDLDQFEDPLIHSVRLRINTDMTNEQVSQHRYKQKQRDLKSNLQNLKFGE